MSFALSFRLALREMRGGLAGFRVFLICLTLGVAAVAAVGSVKTAIETGLTDKGREILGGDAELRLTYRRATSTERAWVSARAEAISEIVDFRSMAVGTSRVSNQIERGLTQVKGVDAAYPLVGDVALTPDLPFVEALAAVDGRFGLIMAPLLIDKMGLQIGDKVRLGLATFELRAALTQEPDGISAGFALGPRIIVLTKALAESGLLGEGSFYESALRVRLVPGADLIAFKKEAKAQDAGWRWRDRRNGAPGIRTFVDRVGAFLVLVGLAALAVGGVGVSAAVRAYLAEKTETIAILKALGAPAGGVVRIYLLQISALTACGVTFGLALGAGGPALVGPYFTDQLPTPVLFDLYTKPMIEAAIYGALTALLFALWPLARTREVRAAALFRDIVTPASAWPRAVDLVIIALVLAALITAALWFSGAATLAVWFLGGVAAALLTLWVIARLLAWLAKRGARRTRGRPALRLALASIGGPGGETTGAALSLGLGLTVLAAVGQVDYNMRRVIDDQLPAAAPAFFFVDIQNSQKDAFLSAAHSTNGVGEISSAPMLRGIITALNGVPADEARKQIDEGAQWVLNGDRGVTYAALPPDGAEITEGNWWPADYSGPPLVSFSAEEGAEMGLKLGDTITVNILGRELMVTIANFRKINWRGMGINFLMVLDPDAMAGAPHSHIATVHATADAEAPLLQRVGVAFPNITAIGVRDAVTLVSVGLAELAAATRWGAGVVLLTGLVVLIGAAAAGERARAYEAAVLKTLGASRGRILVSFAMRAAIVGAGAGVISVSYGAAASWAVMTQVMQSDFVFHTPSALFVIFGGVAASLLAGLGFALSSLSIRPAHILRGRE
jgi:putative ABC transport system permease protein